jgi:AcrR family transcriptional regulator
LGIADGEGLSALTMARVAEKLNVTTMATYRYVPSKEELIDLMIDAAFSNPPTGGVGDWRRDLKSWARAELAMLQARPWMIETVLKRVAIGPNWVAWLDAAFAALTRTPLRTSEKFAAIVLIDGHVRAAAQIAFGAVGEWQENFSQVLASAVSDPRYPALGRALQDAAQEPQRSDSEQMAEQFEFGLERILDGIQSFIDTAQTHRGSHARPSRRRSARH